jgi:hypothetical protein
MPQHSVILRPYSDTPSQGSHHSHPQHHLQHLERAFTQALGPLLTSDSTSPPNRHPKKQSLCTSVPRNNVWVTTSSVHTQHPLNPQPRASATLSIAPGQAAICALYVRGRHANVNTTQWQRHYHYHGITTSAPCLFAPQYAPQPRLSAQKAPAAQGL